MKWLAVAALLLVAPTAWAARNREQIGFGANASGGTGWPVVDVVTLLDNPLGTPLAGSLRAALSGGNRIIRFRVSGNIQLLRPLVVAQPNVTIDGSDAPNGGIALYGYQLIIDTDNVIVRNVRLRGSNTASAVDGLEIAGGNDILIDHVSCSWASDECISLYGYDYTGRGTVRRVTIQNSLIAEMPQTHPMGLLVDGDVSDLTFYRNVFAKSANRNPQIQTGRRHGVGETGGVELSGVGRYELIQNIIYDGVYATRIWNQSHYWTIQLDVIGNLWMPGPAFPRPKLPIMPFLVPMSVGPIKVYFASNLGPVEPGQTGYPCDYFSLEALNSPCGGYSPTYTAAFRLNNTDPIVGRPASEDFSSILTNVGATLPCRDSVDSRVVQEVRSGTGSYTNIPGQLPSLSTCP